MISKDVIKHLAKLSKIGVSDDEAVKMAKQIGDLVGYIEVLKEVDVSGVEITSQVTGLLNVARDDEVVEFDDKEGLVGCSSFPIVNNQIKVFPVIKE